ncbi:dienelactone hydrolase [Sphingomonas panacis]|uniref:Dienelactone hydrolase n=1 Tax=Sphingomonas panacis TaxID=1560345 RepID=A0A1B3ZAQ7_9SPHN|nr:dienelactone hydrolase family protein [Sphingomonas panacis]AOH84518.1 dienelactone hydrolase [Sphingomonas panacis]
MSDEQVTIQTRDGACPAHVLTPAAEGAWPAVIFYMDGVGIRPTVIEMARRLAANGYVVLVPDMFYRYGPYAPFDPKAVFAEGFRKVIGPLMATTGNDKAASDTEGFLAYLDTRKDVAGSKIGTVGFCMGGGMAITAAGTFPDRVAAAISFHGGYLASDADTSPHLLAPKIKADVYVAGADDDDSYPPEMAERLTKAFDEAGVTYKAEIYPGALHGWMKPDFPVYNEVAAERGWREMLALFKRTLG